MSGFDNYQLKQLRKAINKLSEMIEGANCGEFDLDDPQDVLDNIGDTVSDAKDALEQLVDSGMRLFEMSHVDADGNVTERFMLRGNCEADAWFHVARRAGWGMGWQMNDKEFERQQAALPDVWGNIALEVTTH